MKARVVDKAVAAVWLYLPQLDEEIAETVKTAAQQCGMTFGQFGPASAGMKLSDILSSSVQSGLDTEIVPPKQPVLLMDGVDRAGLDRLLAALRQGFGQKNLPGIALKAVVTPTNRGWRFDQLAEELQNKRALLNGYKQMSFYGIQVEKPELVKEYLEKGFALLEEGETEDKGVFTRLQGWYYLYKKEYKKAEEKFREAIEIFKSPGEVGGCFRMSSAACYGYLGDLYKAQGKMEEAAYYYETALKTGTDKVMTNGLGQFYSGLGQVRMLQERFREGEGLLQKALECFKHHGYYWGRERAEAYMALLLLKEGTAEGPNVMYFETGQGSELSSNAHHGTDQVTMEARCYGFAKRFQPFLVNTVVGFIGPEYLYDARQVTRAGLEDHFMGKLTGISMGCDCCYTNHMKADQNDIENLASLLTLAGCNYFMGIPHGDDIMLNYQTTGFRETATLRELTGKTAIPEFQGWLEKMGFVENGKLTKKAGDGSSLLF